jgi:protein-arginine kinase activator protein McsA
MVYSRILDDRRLKQVIFNIIFLIIKIIGILLLAIIALLLLLVLTVLIVPIRYSANVEHGSSIYADGRVNWLLHLINVRISYAEEIFHIKVRLLVFTLYDNLKPKKSKKVRQTVSKKYGRSVLKSGKSRVISGDADGYNKKKNSNMRSCEINSNKDSSEDAKNDCKNIDYDNLEFKKHDDMKNISDINNSDNKVNQSITSKNIIYENKSDSNTYSSTQTNKKKKSLFSIAEKIKNIFERVKTFFIDFRGKIIKLFKTALDIQLKIKLVTDFLQDAVNREGFRLTYSQIKKILKHILPHRLKSTIRFGTGDPCSTGQALGAMSILYSFYGDKIIITPDFENKVLEGKHYARGRISLITILIIVFKLIKDKRFKQLKRNFQLLKEAL